MRAVRDGGCVPLAGGPWGPPTSGTAPSPPDVALAYQPLRSNAVPGRPLTGGGSQLGQSAKPCQSPMKIRARPSCKLRHPHVTSARRARWPTAAGCALSNCGLADEAGLRHSTTCTRLHRGCPLPPRAVSCRTILAGAMRRSGICEITRQMLCSTSLLAHLHGAWELDVAGSVRGSERPAAHCRHGASDRWAGGLASGRKAIDFVEELGAALICAWEGWLGWRLAGWQQGIAQGAVR